MFDFNPRQHEKQAKLYITPFDAHQGSEEIDLFGQQPFSSVNGEAKLTSQQGNSHNPSPPVETDVFGFVPFTGGSREMPSKNKGPMPSKTSSDKQQLDPFGSEPFTGEQITKTSHRATVSSSNQLGKHLNYGQESLKGSTETDQFGHAPFVVTENKLFKQSDSFHSSSSSTSFSPPLLSTSCSEDLLITNRR